MKKCSMETEEVDRKIQIVKFYAYEGQISNHLYDLVPSVLGQNFQSFPVLRHNPWAKIGLD